MWRHDAKTCNNMRLQPVIICNGEMCADVCEDGSIELDSWVTGALALQRLLQDNRSLSTIEWLGTHNALISRANGFGRSEDTAMALMARSHAPNETTVRVANQRHGLLDLLAMGVRHIEIDVWWLSGADIHICHSPVPDPLYVLDLDLAADAANVTRPAWVAQHELCSNITFTSVLDRLHMWLGAPGNEREFLALFLVRSTGVCGQGSCGRGEGTCGRGKRPHRYKGSASGASNWPIPQAL